MQDSRASHGIHPSHLWDRLEELERQTAALAQQNRWLRRLGVALLLVGTSFGLMAADAPRARHSESEKISLVDRNGKQRALLTMGSSGPALQFLDDKGQRQSVLETRADGMVLQLVDGQGRLTTGISLEPTGLAIVSVGRDGTMSVGANAIKPEAGMLAPPK